MISVLDFAIHLFIFWIFHNETSIMIHPCLLYLARQYSKYILNQILPISSSVSGIVVSIAAFQAVDPGLIPGWRIFYYIYIFIVEHLKNKPKTETIKIWKGCPRGPVSLACYMLVWWFDSKWCGFILFFLLFISSAGTIHGIRGGYAGNIPLRPKIP